MANQQYFNDEDIQHFREYVLTTEKWQKDDIYNKYLFKFIDKQIDTVIKQMNVGGSKHIKCNYEDLKQELHIHIYTNVITKIDITRVQAIQNYIYISIRNKLINILKSYDSRIKIKFDYNDYNIDESMLVDDYELSIDDIIKIIDNRIEYLKHLPQTSSSIYQNYLNLLEEYIHTNDYDSSGFKQHAKDTLGINDRKFSTISHSLGFRTIAFKNKKNTIE